MRTVAMFGVPRSAPRALDKLTEKVSSVSTKSSSMMGILNVLGPLSPSDQVKDPERELKSASEVAVPPLPPALDYQ